jgi:surface antigen
MFSLGFGSVGKAVAVSAVALGVMTSGFANSAAAGDGWRGGHGGHWRGDHWRGDHWRGGSRVIVTGPGYYYGRSHHHHRHNHFGTADAIALGLFGALVIDAISDNQRRRHEDAYDRALRAPVGQNIIWNDGANNGNVRITRDGHAGDKYCREFQQTITVAGERQDAWGVACQEPDGSWRLVKD